MEERKGTVKLETD